MGTVVSFDVPASAEGTLGEAVRWLHWVDATFSPYREDSDVSGFGRGSLALADCAPELAEVLAACADVSARSGGYFTTTPGGRFDPSGYVKGWAIERAAALLTFKSHAPTIPLRRWGAPAAARRFRHVLRRDRAR